MTETDSSLQRPPRRSDGVVLYGTIMQTSRFRILGAVCTLCIALAFISIRGCMSQRDHRAMTLPGNRPPAGAVKLQIGAVVDRVRRALTNDANGVVLPDALLTDVNATLAAIVGGDSDEYFDYRMSNGGVFNRKHAIGLLGTWNDLKIIDVPVAPEMTDRELLATVWRTAPARRMQFQSLLPDESQAGRGATIRFGSPGAHWPYSGVQSASALFMPKSGPISHADGSQLDGTDRSAHVTVAGILADGTKAYLRLNYFFDEASRQWIAVTIGAGSDAKDYWPWPVF